MGGPYETHAPEGTFVYEFDPATRQVTRRDKFPPDVEPIGGPSMPPGDRTDGAADEGARRLPVLKDDWDGLPDTGARFMHRTNPYDDGPSGIEAEGALLLLTQRWKASWATEASSTTIPLCPPELVEAARQILGPKRDVTRSGPSHARLLEEASSALARGLWEADPEQLYRAYDVIRQIVGKSHPETYAIGTTSEQYVNLLPDEMLSGTDVSAKVDPESVKYAFSSHKPKSAKLSSVTAFFLQAVQAMNERIRDLASSGEFPADAAGPGVRGQLSHLIEEVLRAAMAGHTLRVNAETIEALTGSSAPRDQARLEAFWKVFPDVQWAAGQGALAPPAIMSWKDGAVVSSAAGPAGQPVRREPPVIDDREPWKIFAMRSSEADQILDRGKGTLTLELTDARAPYTKTIRFEPWQPEDGEAARRRQDETLRSMEAFAVAHFDGTWNLPDHLVMEAGRIRAGRLTLAEHAPEGWRLDRAAVREAISSFGTYWIEEEPALSEWSLPGKSLGVTRTAGILDELRIVLQVQADDASQALGNALADKAPAFTIWIQRGPSGESRIVHGEALAQLVGPETSIKLMIAGHGFRVWNDGGTITVGNHGPTELSRLATDTLRGYGIHRPADHVVLFSCALESLAADTGFAEPFLRSAYGDGLVTPSASVTAYRHLMYVPERHWRRTSSPFRGAERRHRAPDVTLIYQRHAETGEITVRDKYPAMPVQTLALGLGLGLGRGEVDDLSPEHRRSALSFDGADDVGVAPERARGIPQAGQAGKLFELFSTLKGTLKKVPIDAMEGFQAVLLGETPDAIATAVLRRLGDLGAEQPQADADLLPRAARLIADGLWRQDPDLLHDGFVALSRAYDPFPQAPRHWQVDDRPMGVIDRGRMPSALLSRSPRTLALPIEEFAFMESVDAGVRALDGGAAGTANDPVRLQLGRQTLALLQATLSGRPFTVDADHLDALAASGEAGDRARLRVLEIVHGTSMKLARKGVMPAPVYLTDFAREPSDAGWARHEDGSRVHHGDLLPDLLAGRRAQITRARTNGSADFDEVHPLSRLFAFMPDAKQQLDRGAGTITIVWPRTPEGPQADSVLRFAAADAMPGSHSQRVQEAEIRAVDEFLVGAFFDSSVSSLNAVPGDLRFDGVALTAGRATLAGRKDGGWVPVHEALRQHWSAVGHGGGSADRSKPVSSWDFDLHGLRWPKERLPRGGASKLRVLLQMEDDPVMLRYARRSIVRHRDEMVWIQVDSAGNHVIRWGERLLRQAAADLPVKIEITGHGRHDLATRSQALSGYLSTTLVDRVAQVLDQLQLKGRAEQVTLVSCALETPSVQHSFGAEFLDHAIRQGVIRPDAVLVSYSEHLKMHLEAGEEARSRFTRRYPGADEMTRAPDVTWVFKKNPGTGEIVRTDKYPAGEGDSYGLAAIQTVEPSEVRDLRPGAAGRLSELFSTLTSTQARGGLMTLTAGAPDAVVENTRANLAALFSQLDDDIPVGALPPVARLIADGVWQRDPEKLRAAYIQLSDIGDPLGRDVAELSWSGLPTGLVERARMPSQLLQRFDPSMDVPLHDAALLFGLQSAVSAMDRLPLETRPDPVGRSYARQTLALLEVMLSERPFAVDADAVIRMSLSDDANDHAALDVLDVVHGTAMQLARSHLLQTPIYLSDAPAPAPAPGVGWTSYPDGSRVHRGDLLASLLPQRQARMASLQTPIDVEVDEATPLARLARFMPQATQTLDRAAGTIRIVWPGMKDGPQADSLLRFRPSDAGSGLESRRLQDADLRMLDEFIVAEFGHSPGLVRNGVPGELTIHEDRVTAGRSVLAERKEGQWRWDVPALQELHGILDPRELPIRALEPATSWRPADDGALPDMRAAGEGARLLVHLQMEDDLVMWKGAHRTLRSHPDETVWIQVDRAGHHVIRYGKDLLERAGAALPVKIEISGHGSHDHATRTQQLSGYGATALADRVASVIEDIGLTSRAGKLTLVSCAIETPVLADSFADAFMAAAIDKGILRKDATMVAYGEVLTRKLELEGKEPSRRTVRYPGAAATNHARGVTWMFRKDPDTGRIERIDKYPDGGPGAGAEADDEDSAWNRLAEHLDDRHARTRESVADGLAGRTLHVDGIEVPMDFLATLGAQIDGEPLTRDLLRAIADVPGDPVARLKIDADLFEQWVTLLTDRPDAEIADRLRAMGEWIGARENQSGAGSAFIDEPSPTAREIVDRLTAATAPDADGIFSNDAELLKAARGDDAAPTSLLGDILRGLSPETRAGFDDWLARTGQRIDDVAGMAPPRGSHAADTPIEKVAREIGRRAINDDGIDFNKMQGLNRSNSLASLQEIGVVMADGSGLRLDAGRIQAFMDSRELVKLAYADRALHKLPDKAYRLLVDSAPDGVRRFMTAARERPSASSQSVAAFSDKLDGAVDFIDTILGISQILANWDQMSPTTKGLSVTQSLSIVISPLAMMAGRAMSTLGPVARSGVLRGISAGLAGGVANVAMAGLGVASCVLQWQDFIASGQAWDSHAGKSLIANTVMTSVSAALAVTGAVIGTATFVAGGAAAVSGTALGVASSIMGSVAAPLALAMFVANALTQAVLWFDEFGQHLRASTSDGDIALAFFAKAFGFSTEVTMRAEKEKSAWLNAVSLERSIEAQQQELLEFRVEQLSKQGYDRFVVPKIQAGARPATFRNETADRTEDDHYSYVLQPTRTSALDVLRIVRDRQRADLQPGTAWLSLRSYPRYHRQMYNIDTRNERSRQLFELEGVRDGSVHGGPGDEIYQIDGKTAVDIFGGGGDDEVRIDAGQSNLTIEFTPFAHKRAAAHPPLSPEFPFDPAGSDPGFRVHFDHNNVFQPSRVVGVHRINIRNAKKAEVFGSEKDERFDISSEDGEIRGLGGRNTYLIRNDNRIFVTSNDAAVWTRGVSGASVDVGGDATSSLLLKIDVLHEALSLRRDGQDLVVLIGEESLTLKRHFDGLEPSRGVSAPAVVFVDAVGTVVSLINPGVIGDKAVPLTELDKHLVINTELPDSRRTLSGDGAYNRFQLSSGGGDVRVMPMTGMPMDLSLDVPVERLRLCAEGDDLLIVETPPADAKTDFAPLRLRLSGQRNVAAPASAVGIMVWAKDKNHAPVALVLPEPGRSADGPVRVRASLKAASVGDKGSQPGPASGMPAPASIPGHGTEKEDRIDARQFPDDTVLRGGGGADTYRIRAGQSLVIDNAAMDPAQDVLLIEDIGAREFLEGVRFSRSGGDLEIHVAGGKVTVRNHATSPRARHLSLEVAGRRYALPVMQGGFMVHLAAGTEGDVLATAPGAHLVLFDPKERWDLSAAPRKVWMHQSVEWRRHGASEEGRSTGDHPATVLLMDYHRDPAAWQVSTLAGLEVSHLRASETQLDAVSKGVADIAAAIRADGSRRHPQVDVVAYLKARGMPEPVATQIRSSTTDELRRLHALLTVLIDEGTWSLPAAFIDDYVASDLTPSDRQAPMLRQLASRRAPWAYDERILRRDLSMAQFEAFESWAIARFQSQRGTTRSRRWTTSSACWMARSRRHLSRCHCSRRSWH
ncbi:C80 family cysteine peptidase [Roseateles sp. UC29_93]|uniref:C80 family cysteine peptidase n=1 Tax=Roseateles sp. UC29_93 TaxID=3350177 RepID=UPI00366D9243